ncbi:hypothetical protein GCM10009681_13930 [Luedemannella helvata]|uniref:Uncharacterized protein n=1 Tax=Luedemannella helvata TaxID=349315 RepID=A0ABN2JZB2_9ACTN
MIAAPVRGTFSRPSTCGRNSSHSQGPRKMYFSNQYTIADASLHSGPPSLGTPRPGRHPYGPLTAGQSAE